MNKKLWAINIALLSSLACAEAITWESTCVRNGHRLIASSEHFEICRKDFNNDGTPNKLGMYTSEAKEALDILEDIFVFYHDSLEWFLPQPSSPNRKVKSVVYVFEDDKIESPVGGDHYDACIDNECSPGIWLGKSSLNRATLAHEYAHGLQSYSGWLGSNVYTNWFAESHANWMAHQFVPEEVIGCTEYVINFPYLYYGSTRSRYCNWHFLEHLKEKFGGGFKGVKEVNRIWIESIRDGQEGRMEQTPFTAMNMVYGWPLDTLNDEFGRFAMKQATYEYEPSKKALFSEAWGGYDFSTRRGKGFGHPYSGHGRVTMMNLLDSVENRYISPSYWAPQRWGYNLVRIYPDTVGRVKVKFRGIVQEEKTIDGYACFGDQHDYHLDKSYDWCNLSPDFVPNPASGWRVGLVAEGADGTPRYSEMKRGTAFNLDIETRADDKALWLVVAATPSEMQSIMWDQFYYSLYRFPYMIQVNNGKPEGFNKNFWVPADTSNYTRHSNGGGLVSNKAYVAPSVYVGPNAVVNGGAILGNVRIEDFAVIESGRIFGNAIIRGRALVSSGTIKDNAILEEDAWLVSGTLSGNAKVGALSVIRNTNVKDYAQIYGVMWPVENSTVGGTAQLRGDLETTFSSELQSGIYYGWVDEKMLNQEGYGANRTEPMIEATASIENAQWYRIYEDYYRVQKPIIASISPAQNTNLKATDEMFQVFDLKGKRLGSVNMTQGVSLSETLRAAGFNSGLYLVRGKNTHKMHRINVR